MREPEKVGTAGTGKYQGFVWDGRRWVDPVTMEAGKFDPWDHTGLAWKIVVIVGVASALVYVSWPFVS